jgi:hypothetical protein
MQSILNINNSGGLGTCGLNCDLDPLEAAQIQIGKRTNTTINNFVVGGQYNTVLVKKEDIVW